MKCFTGGHLPGCICRPWRPSACWGTSLGFCTGEDSAWWSPHAQPEKQTQLLIHTFSQTPTVKTWYNATSIKLLQHLHTCTSTGKLNRQRTVWKSYPTVLQNHQFSSFMEGQWGIFLADRVVRLLLAKKFSKMCSDATESEYREIWLFVQSK